MKRTPKSLLGSIFVITSLCTTTPSFAAFMVLSINPLIWMLDYRVYPSTFLLSASPLILISISLPLRPTQADIQVIYLLALPQPTPSFFHIFLFLSPNFTDNFPLNNNVLLISTRFGTRRHCNAGKT